jgi:hypothetical protein
MADAIDWERIEGDYRAGILSLREIADLGGCTEGAIRKRAKREGWVRDLGAKIQAKAEDLVRKQAVRSEYAEATERTIIEANAERIAQVRGEHRRDITRFRALVLKLLAECEAESADPAIFQQIGEILRRPDDNQQDKLNDAYMKAISLPQRIKGVKELADTLKTLVGLEREAYGIATEPDRPPADDGKAPDPEAVARRIASLLDKPEVAGAILAKLQAQLQAKKE